jgi:hypothetical protein
MWTRIYWLILLLISVELQAQDSLYTGTFDPPAIAPVVYAREAKEIIIIDGKLDEASWKEAPVIDDFFRVEPRQGGSYLHDTQVRLLFDKKNLYVGVFCQDSLGKKGMRVQDLRRDFLPNESDNFYIAIDAQNTKRFCVVFNTTPLGNQRDLQVFDDSYKDNEWDALWKVRTHITDRGYYAEFAIPFSSLRYDKALTPSESTSWRISFSRLARRDYEQTTFPAVPQAFSAQRMTYAAELIGLKLPPPSLNLRMQPYGLYQYGRTTNQAGDVAKKSEFKAGGEIKWAVNPHAVVDLTFNTDFAQADVDRVVNNLSRFNVLFPERRQFFLENSGIWAGADFYGTKPFFSRSIGLDNSGGYNAEPVRIDGGIRYTDRTEHRTIAGLYMHQQRGTAIGASNFGVIRYLKSVGKQNNVGLMFTHRLDEADTEKSLRQKNNSTLTVDGLFRPRNDLTLQFLVSSARDNNSDSIGTMGTLYAEYKPNNFFWQYWTKWVSKKYRPGMGFVFGNDVIYHKTGGYYIWRPKKLSLIRRWDPGVFVHYYQSASTGKLQQAEIDIFPLWIFFKDNSKLTWDVFLHRQEIDFEFQPLSIPIAQGSYFYTRNNMAYSSDASKKLSGSVAYEWGSYYNGKLRATSCWLRYAPMPNLSLRADYSNNHFKGIGEIQQDITVDVYSAELRLAYTPRLQASLFYQYNSLDKQGRWNMRASWEFAPLSFLYIVFNESAYKDNPMRNQSIINKITYLKQF